MSAEDREARCPLQSLGTNAAHLPPTLLLLSPQGPRIPSGSVPPALLSPHHAAAGGLLDAGHLHLAQPCLPCSSAGTRGLGAAADWGAPRRVRGGTFRMLATGQGEQGACCRWVTAPKSTPSSLLGAFFQAKKCLLCFLYMWRSALATAMGQTDGGH